MDPLITTKGQLGPLLTQLRRQRGLSQQALGDKIGLSQERISRIEHAPEKVTVDQLLTVLMALGLGLSVVRRPAAGAPLPTLKVATSTSASAPGMFAPRRPGGGASGGAAKPPAKTGAAKGSPAPKGKRNKEIW